MRLQLRPKTKGRASTPGFKPNVMQRGLIQPASKVRDRTLARKGGKGPEMTLNFAVKAD